MFAFLKRQKGKFLFSAVSRLLTFVLSFSLVFGPSAAQAQSIASLNLPVPGAMVGPSQAFVPVLLKGMTIHPDNPLQFDFIIDSGNTNFTQDQIKDESQRLVKYFLASMTIPKDDLWVNLSPYEKDRIIPDELGKTELGRDMLAQDYILKQLTASLMYPEKELGKAFWDKVYKQAKEKFGTTEIPVDTFNKVWILPETATVYEHGQTVYIVEAKLKVMLDNDYLAMQQETKDQRLKTKDFQSNEGKSSVVSLQSSVSSTIIKEVILPAIKREVNEGQNFAPLRQIYHSLILAKWYKETIKNSLLSKIYIDQRKIAGVNIDDATLKDQIYAQYMEAYKKGVFNYIKEDYDQLSAQPIPRKYFSGGIKGDVKITKSSSPIRESNSPKYQTTVEIKAQGKEGIASKVSRAAIAALLAATTCVGAGCATIGATNSNEIESVDLSKIHDQRLKEINKRINGFHLFGNLSETVKELCYYLENKDRDFLVKEGMPILINLLKRHNSKDYDFQRVINLVGKARDPRAVPTLIKLLKTGHRSVAFALIYTGDSRALLPVLEALNDDAFPLGTKELQKFVLDFFLKTAEDNREIIASLSKKDDYSANNSEILKQRLKENFDLAREILTQTKRLNMNIFLTPELSDFVKSFGDDYSPIIAQLVVPLLIEKIKSSDTHTNPDNIKAILAIGNLGPLAKASIPFLEQTYYEAYYWSNQREAISNSLAQLGQAAVPSLLRMFVLGDFSNRIKIFRAMAKMDRSAQEEVLHALVEYQLSFPLWDDDLFKHFNQSGPEMVDMLDSVLEPMFQEHPIRRYERFPYGSIELDIGWQFNDMRNRLADKFGIEKNSMSMTQKNQRRDLLQRNKYPSCWNMPEMRIQTQ